MKETVFNSYTIQSVLFAVKKKKQTLLGLTVMTDELIIVKGKADEFDSVF